MHTKHCHHHNCIDELKSDHQNILTRLDDLETIINQSEINFIKVKEFLHFTEVFVEPHHQKEELVLFPSLEKIGIPNKGGPIGIMLSEHNDKRDYIVKMKNALTENNEIKLKENTQQMISLLRNHIYKENNILYPAAENILTKEELNNLASRCEKIKSQKET